MSIAIIDAREWQNVFDLRTGDKLDATGSEVDIVKAVLARHPFPGDTDEKSDAWVTDTALDLINEYNPEFVWLTYASQFYNCRYMPLTTEEKATLFDKVAFQINRFCEESGFTPIIVGTGSLGLQKSLNDISRLDGFALATHWAVRYAGLHEPSAADLEKLKSMSNIIRIASKEELMALFPDAPCDSKRLPDYLLVAADNCGFKATGGFQRRVLDVNVATFQVPVSNHIGECADIRDIHSLVLESLKQRKTAVITVEGFGFDEFRWPYSKAINGRDWYFYEPGDAQYLTMSTGEHRLFDYPMGYRYYDDDAEDKEFPFSGYFTSMPTGTIGENFAGRSIAVGNRSMYMHTLPGTDLSIECFARNLANQGMLGVVHRQGK